MSTSFRRNVRTAPIGPEEFISGAKTAVSLEEGRAVESAPPQPTLVEARPDLNPRIMRQVNIDVPETLHYELRELVDTMPKMSMRKFILEAIAEKMQSVRAGRR